MSYRVSALLIAGAIVLLGGCAAPSATTSGTAAPSPAAPQAQAGTEYQIGPGDVLEIFVWRNNDVSTSVPVRPDGKISTPLVEDMQAAGKTPTILARDIEVVLQEYIKNPSVTVIVKSFVGAFSEQIRVIGQAAQPRALSYRQNLTLLDVLIEVGGLGPYAAPKRAKVVRRIDGKLVEIKVRPDLLIDRGDLRYNLQMRPGDVLIIPEARF